MTEETAVPAEADAEPRAPGGPLDGERDRHRPTRQSSR